MGAIATITRREVRDMMSDWRIVVPVFLLTFILPLLLVGASLQVIRFVEEVGLVERLVPFAVLLVGFVPASFSLITALESFVGERERNSLESLLAMPINDNELYIGKLFSSLITPLLSSYIAMLVFSFLLYAIDPTLYLGAVTLPRLVLLFITVGLMAIAMVSGAVVISSHIGSIRAANLMSSFILVPMAIVVQIAAVLIINERWDVMWIIGVALLVLTVLLVRSGLVMFNREEILSREHQQLSDMRFLKFFARFRLPQKAGKLQTRPAGVVATIANREFRESVTDWRMLAPSFVLTFVIPVALVAGGNFAIDFLQDPKLIARIIPFVVLLVGFIPASFSLIVALDSFVGERERNSLEALLALPVLDRDLYVSKLSSSFMAPIITSWSAMLFFSLATAVIHPTLYYYAMTPLRLVQMLVMIAIMTLVMVAGAVVISSHTGSIRAANLLASFVLIPMAVVIQLQALLVIATRWDLVWITIAILVVVAIALIRSGMAAFNREEILSREHEQMNLSYIGRTFTTFFREYQPAGVLPDAYEGKGLSPRRFYRYELPALLREIRYPLAVALLAVVGGIGLGYYLAVTSDHNYIRGLERAIRNVGYAPPPSLPLALMVFVNNIRVSILSNVFSMFSFGLFAFMVPLVAFIQVSFIATRFHTLGGEWLALGDDSPMQFLLAYVVPHGIVELPVFTLSAALGIRIGASLMATPKGFSVGQNILWSLANFARVWVLLFLPLVLVASLIEGFISPQIIRALYGG